MNKGEYHDYVVTDNTLELSLEPGDGVFLLPMYTFISHKYQILVRSTGIEDIRRYEKSLDFQGFFTLNAKVDAKIFLGRYDVAGLI